MCLLATWVSSSGMAHLYPLLIFVLGGCSLFFFETLKQLIKLLYALLPEFEEFFAYSGNKSFVRDICSKSLPSCHGLNFIHWSPSTRWDDIWSWGLSKVIRVRRGQVGGAPVMGFIRRGRERNSSLCQVRTPRRRPSLQDKKGTLTRNEFASILIWDFPASRIVKTKCLLLKQPSPWL